MLRLIAGACDLAIPAVVKVPVALQLGARRLTSKVRRDGGPGQNAMPIHVGAGDGISDPLVAERWHEPRTASAYHALRWRPGCVLDQLVAQVIDQRRTACQAANGVHEAERAGVALS